MRVEQFPEITIQYRRLVSFAPTTLFPAFNPLIQSLDAVIAIGSNKHLRAVWKSIKPTNNRGEFHAIVGGSQLPAALKQFVWQVPTAQNKPPTARAGIAGARSIGEQFILQHQGDQDYRKQGRPSAMRHASCVAHAVSTTIRPLRFGQAPSGECSAFQSIDRGPHTMLPAFRTSPGRTRRRRAHQALTAAHTVNCPNCGANKRPHTACRDCGYVRPGLQLRVAQPAA